VAGARRGPARGRLRPAAAGTVLAMRLKAALVAALLALSLVGLVACGGSSNSSTESGGATSVETEEEGGEAAAGGNGGEETESETAPSGQARKAEKVEIIEFTYSPDPVVVQVGGKVTWKNDDSPSHTATADDGSFETGVIETGKAKSETFKEAGTFTYFCKIHPFMHGSVEVVEKE
jgi:plastocyanin